MLYYGIIFYKTSIRLCLQSIISPFAPWFNYGRIEGREKRKGLWHCPILLFLQQTNMWTPAFQFQLQTRNILANFPMIIRCNRVAIQDNNKSKYEIVPILGSKQVSSEQLSVCRSPGVNVASTSIREPGRWWWGQTCKRCSTMLFPSDIGTKHLHWQVALRNFARNFPSVQILGKNILISL